MKIEQDTKTGGADITFTWREVWIIIKYRKLRFDQASFKAFSGKLLKCIMDWNLHFDIPLIKQVEQKDIVGPDAKTNK